MRRTNMTAWAAMGALTVALGTARSAPGQCPGDCGNGDGAIGVEDLVALVLQWGAPGPCDIDGSGTIDVGDLVALVLEWGACPTVGACCMPADLSCTDGTSGDCEAAGGLFMGQGTACHGEDCTTSDVTTGACCTVAEGCQQLDGSDCAELGGMYGGDDTSCGVVECCQCQWAPETCAQFDCNGNGVLDTCDVTWGFSTDCNQNGSPDECDDDCNQNGISDSCELDGNDCNQNGVPDDCDPQCAGAGMPDDCYLAQFPEADCDANGMADACELADDDCNGNGVPDTCEIAGGLVDDCNGNGIPDGCEALMDCDSNGVPDDCQLAQDDCNGNSVPDACDIASGASPDGDRNGVPDECQSPCDADIDVDSDNTGLIEQSDEEDLYEMTGAGKFIAFNDDDDNGSGLPDYLDPGGDALEDDLVRLTLSGACAELNFKAWTVSYPGSLVRLYRDPWRLEPVESNALGQFPVPAELWVEGIAPSSNRGDVIITLDLLLAGDEAVAKDKVKATVLAPVVEAVDFDSGIDLYDPADDKKRPETGAEWVRNPARSLQAAYIRTGGATNPSRKLLVDFSINAEFTGKLKVKATSSDTLTIGEVEADFKKGKAEKVEMSLGHVPDSIKRFTDLTFTWRFDVGKDGSFSHTSERTTHTIYVIRAAPIKITTPAANDKLYYQLYELSCDWAAGKKEKDETFDAMWAKVDDRDATPYGYYCPDVPTKADGTAKGFEVRELIHDKNGRCGAWGPWFVRMNEVHGIDADILSIEPDFTMTYILVAGLAAKGFMVKNWTAPADAPPIVPRLTNAAGVPGQQASGGPACGKPAAKWFNNHCVTVYTNNATTPVTRIYDPSYGTVYEGGTAALRLKAWDTAALDFFTRKKEIRIDGVDRPFTFYEANPATQDVKGTEADR